MIQARGAHAEAVKSSNVEANCAFVLCVCVCVSERRSLSCQDTQKIWPPKLTAHWAPVILMLMWRRRGPGVAYASQSLGQGGLM